MASYSEGELGWCWWGSGWKKDVVKDVAGIDEGGELGCCPGVKLGGGGDDLDVVLGLGHGDNGVECWEGFGDVDTW